MLGSAFSIAGPNIALNTTVAEVLRGFADTLEKSPRQVSSAEFTANLTALVQDTVSKHKRIIFNGNNYGADCQT